MFNVTGGEIVIILILALIVLGPEKLPDAIRKFGQFYGEFKRMGTGFQTELRSALDEPMREIRETMNLAKGVFDEPLNELKQTANEVNDTAKGAADIFSGKTTSFSARPVAPAAEAIDPVLAAERQSIEDVGTEGEDGDSDDQPYSADGEAVYEIDDEVQYGFGDEGDDLGQSTSAITDEAITDETVTDEVLPASVLTDARNDGEA